MKRAAAALMLCLTLWGCPPPGYIVEVKGESTPPLIHIYEEGSFFAQQKRWFGKAPCVERIYLSPGETANDDSWSLKSTQSCTPLEQLAVGQTPPGFTVVQPYQARPGRNYALDIVGSEHRRGRIVITL